MERHDMMNRAARSVLGAGTFAAAMLAIGVGHASATTTACDDENALVCGHVYTETNGTPTFQVGEGTTEVVTVVLVDAGGNPVESATPSNPTTTSCNDGPGNAGCAYYSFNAPPGDYKVCILLSSGEKTACQPVSTQFVDIPFDSGGENSVPPDTEA